MRLPRSVQHVLVVSPSGGAAGTVIALERGGLTVTSWTPGADNAVNAIGDVVVLDLSSVSGPGSRQLATELAARVAGLTRAWQSPAVFIANPEDWSLEDAIESSTRGGGTYPRAFLSPDEVDANLCQIVEAVRERAYIADLRELLDETKHALFETDAAGNTIETSKTELEILGYADPAEILGKPRKYTHWLSAERERELHDELLERGKVNNYVALFKKRGGREPVWIQGDFQLLRGPSNKPAGVRGFYKDITGTYAETIYQVALSTIARQRSTVDQIPGIVCKAVRETAVARMVVFLALDPWNDVLIVRHIEGDEVAPEVRQRAYFRMPGESPLAPPSLEEMPLEPDEELLVRRVGPGGSVQAFLWIVGRFTPVEGTSRMLQLDVFLDAIALCLQTAVALQISRLTNTIHAAARDTDDTRNRADEFLARLVEALREEVPFEGCSIFRKAVMSNKVYLAATTGLHGNPKKADVSYVVGHGLTGRVAETGQQIVSLDVDRDHIAKFHEAVRLPPRSWIGMPIVAPGRVVVGVLRAVNRRRDHESDVISPFTPWDVEIIAAASKQAEIILSLLNAQEQRAQLLTRVTHEIRAPATAIRSILDMLKRRSGDDDRFASKIEDLELNSAVLLDLAQTLDGLFGPPRQRSNDDMPVAIRPVLLAVIHVMRPEFRAKHIDISSIDVAQNLPSVRMKRTALTQIFFNLFQNALRYATPAAADFRVEISCNTTTRRTLIHFRDNGVGVSEDDKARIFEPGVRGTNAHRFSTRGTGLGLAICRQIMRDHGGTIELTSLHAPTEFTLTFPSSKVVTS